MSGAWTPAKVEAFSDEYYRFRKHVYINSKEMGRICLGDNTYRSQKLLLDSTFEGLSRDIHDFKTLKSRQLGITTESRSLTLFWNGIHDGLRGYMLFDTDGHKEEARLELIAMLEMLPAKVDFPRIKRQNRTLLELKNGSVINFASAGVRESSSSGTLGRSSGVNFCHASEMCSWNNTEGLESFKNAMAEDFENRLYIWESTARGFNQWHDMWMEAKLDPSHQKCLFLGWWSKDNQKIEKTNRDFERYGTQPPTQLETRKIAEVAERYNWQITPEQLAWIRRKMDPTAQGEGDAPAEYVTDPLKIQEQPWTEEDAFQMTAATFFDSEKLTDQAKKNATSKFKTYSYSTGIEFVDCRAYPAHNAKSVQLKVWEPPEIGGVYIIAADPAFGENERNDRSAIQVIRGYSDGIDQVAEFAWPTVNTRQFGWVIASLLGWYGMEDNEVFHILELNGPGSAVWNELQSLKQQIQYSYQPKEMEERGLTNIFQNVRNYIYTRSDSMSPGKNWQFKTSGPLKVQIMERLRDFTENGMARWRSQDLLEEMECITRSGDSIKAEGSNKDDRVVAAALAIRCWEERARRNLMILKKTRDHEAAKKRLTIRDQITQFNTSQIDQFFAVKKITRQRQRALAMKSWRSK